MSPRSLPARSCTTSALLLLGSSYSRVSVQSSWIRCDRSLRVRKSAVNEAEEAVTVLLSLRRRVKRRAMSLLLTLPSMSSLKPILTACPPVATMALTRVGATPSTL